MAILFHVVSGCPYAWRVWLALEHKRIPYELRVESKAAGDCKKPEFLALNPRARAPVIVDDGFVLYESAAIVEYLDHRSEHAGPPLFPRDLRGGAVVRRLVREVDQYVQWPMEHVEEHLLKPAAERDVAALAAAESDALREIAWFESMSLTGDWLFGDGPTAADYSLYPMIALLLRLETKHGGITIRKRIGPRLRAWMSRVEALPHFAATIPPHWR